MSTIQKFREMFGVEPTDLQRKQAYHYGGEDDPLTPPTFKRQIARYLEVLRDRTGLEPKDLDDLASLMDLRSHDRVEHKIENASDTHWYNELIRHLTRNWDERVKPARGDTITEVYRIGDMFEAERKDRGL